MWITFCFPGNLKLIEYVDSKKNMHMIGWKKIRLSLLCIILLTGMMWGCATNKPRKLPKRGAIPCPIKDC